MAQKDLRFARTIQRLQRSLIAELEKIATVHLYLLGFRGDDLINFKLRLNNPSKISELQELETWRTKFDVASAAVEGFFSKRWIAQHLFDVSEEEYLRNQRELFFDRKISAQLDQVAEEVVSPAGAGAGGGLGDDLGGDDLDTGLEDEAPLGADEPPGGEETGDSPAAEGDDVLLAEPGAEPVGKRDDGPTVYKDASGMTTTRDSKHKMYRPVTHDKRRTSGPRKKQMTAMGSHEMARMPSRQVRMNLPSGAKELLGLGKGIFENKETNYDDKEEKHIFEVREEIKKIFEDLDQV